MKTTWAGFSGTKIDLLPHVGRAARLFGGVEPAEAPRLGHLLAKHMDEGRVAERIAATGFPDRAGTLRLVVERAMAWAYDEEHARQRVDPDVVRVYDIAVFHSGEEACDAARRLDGATFPSASAPRVPLDACRSDGCWCSIEAEISRRRTCK